MKTACSLVIQPISDDELERIATLAPCMHLLDVWGMPECEFEATWPEWSVQRCLAGRQVRQSTRAERHRLLANAEVILGG